MLRMVICKCINYHLNSIFTEKICAIVWKYIQPWENIWTVFREQSNKSVHERVHSGSKPFSENNCDS